MTIDERIPRYEGPATLAKDEVRVEGTAALEGIVLYSAIPVEQKNTRTFVKGTGWPKVSGKFTSEDDRLWELVTDSEVPDLNNLCSIEFPWNEKTCRAAVVAERTPDPRVVTLRPPAIRGRQVGPALH